MPILWCRDEPLPNLTVTRSRQHVQQTQVPCHVRITRQTGEEHVSTMEVLYGLGKLTWDQERRVHIQKFNDEDLDAI